MGLAYLFALVVALGVLILQIIMGARGGGHHGDLGHAGNEGHTQGAHSSDEPAPWTLFLTVRFWVFAALGFGLSGSLMHLFALAHPILTFGIAAAAGLGSGLFAALAFRAVKRGSTSTEARSSGAVGKVGRVVVPCGRALTGQVRVELGGSSVDLMATTDDEAIGHGELVIVAEVREGIAHVSRRPVELG